jgi:hypothetical protein
MICPKCYGKHVVTEYGKVVPCPECGGLGELHCCDGLQEQKAEENDRKDTKDTKEDKDREKDP